jgi:hypothetical protein
MKLNWGYSITIVYLAFAIGIMAMVYLTTLENRDLVSEDYYEQELAYQKVIDNSANTAALSTPINLSRNGNELVVAFPIDFNTKKIYGKWSLYYAADKNKDLKGSFQTSNGKYEIRIPENIQGQFLLKMDWEVGDDDFYFEQNIFF